MNEAMKMRIRPVFMFGSSVVFCMMRTPLCMGFRSVMTMRSKSAMLKKCNSDPSTVILRGNQEQYVEMLQDPDYPIVVATGSAGTGKTMLACREAIRSLVDRSVDRIVITRPTVNSDEELGFLPGDMQTKMSPWVRPIMDHMYELVSPQQVNKWVQDRTIEIAPLCFMRGRTFKGAFVIGDECQNMRPMLLKMLLTRLGYGSKMVIVGDTEQSDLPPSETNGLTDFIQRAESRKGSKSDGIGVIHLTDECIQRHPLIAHVLDLYRTL